MNVDQYREYLLSNLPNAKSAAGGREVVTDCPFCGKKGHLYIGMPATDRPSMYNCFVCSESGVVKGDFLYRYFGLGSSGEVELFLRNSSKEYDSSIHYNKQAKVFQLYNPVATSTDINLKKLGYVNNRLGLNLSLEEVAANKIVLNLYELLNYNKIPKLTRDPRIVQAMSDFFLGFLSMDNGYVNLRKLTNMEIHPSLDKRYVNYNVTNAEDNHRRYYIPPVMVNIEKPISIHIAEGPFDILSIKYNLRQSETNPIFIAGCGKSYLNVIKLLLEDFGFISMEFHIYMDNDNDVQSIYNIIDYLRVFDYKFYIHYNTYPGEKDFGVPLARISEHIERAN